MKRILIVLFSLTLFSSTTLAQKRPQAETLIQFIPASMDLVLPALGVKADRDYVDVLLSFGGAYLSDIIVTEALKAAVNEERPDGSGLDAFPSGHSSRAFTGAELVRMEYGWGWGAAAYGTATAVSALRIAHDKHFWWDCAAGAGIGILSAHVGEWLQPLARRCWDSVFGPSDAKIALSPAYDPMTGAAGAVLAINF